MWNLRYIFEKKIVILCFCEYFLSAWDASQTFLTFYISIWFRWWPPYNFDKIIKKLYDFLYLILNNIFNKMNENYFSVLYWVLNFEVLHYLAKKVILVEIYLWFFLFKSNFATTKSEKRPKYRFHWNIKR